MKNFVSLFLGLLWLSLAFSQTIYSTSTGGNWDDPNTWQGGVVPSATDNVEIVAGATVTLNTEAEIASLTVEGTLTFGNDATSRKLTVDGNVTLSSGGAINKAAFDITDTLLIKGNLTIDSTLDLYNSLSQQVRLIFDPGSGNNVSVSGSGSNDLAAVQVLSGTVSTSINLDVNGDFYVASGATFDDGGNTVNLAGSITSDGTITSTGTWIFDGSWVQQINSVITFGNVTVNGGGTLVISSSCAVSGDFYVTNNSEVDINTNVYFHSLGNFTVDDGSKFLMTNGRVYFEGSGSQNINIGTTDGQQNCTFYIVIFDNGGSSNPKTITGNFVANSWINVYDDAYVTDAADTYVHKLNGATIDGSLDLTSKVLLYGGTYTTNNSSFSITSNVIETHNNIAIPADKTFNVLNDLFVYPDDNNAIRGISIYGDLTGTSGHKLVVEPYGRLMMYGSDNFPSGFDTVVFKQNSYAYYWADAVQFVSDQTSYWHLYLRYQTKYAKGDLTIRGNLYLYNQVTFSIGSYDVDLYGNIDNSTDRDGSVSSSGTFRIIANGRNLAIMPYGTNGQYAFKDLILEMQDTAISRYINILADIDITGDFKVFNRSGTQNLFRVRIYDDHILDGGDSLILGDYTRLVTWGSTNFKDLIGKFSDIKMYPKSIVRFARNVSGSTQTIPATGTWSYGDIEVYGISKKILDGNIVLQGDMVNVGGGAVLSDDAHQINIAGNWRMSLVSTDLTGTNLVVFDGDNQAVYSSHFQDVTFQGTGTKNILGGLDIGGDLTINGVTVYNNQSNIYIAGNWTESSDAKYLQDANSVYFDGDADQTIQSSDNSSFYNFYVYKQGTSKLVTLASDIHVAYNVDLYENDAALDLGGHTLYIGHSFIFRNGTSFTHSGGTVHFDGNNQSQGIYDYNDAQMLTFYNLEFSGTATKVLYGGDIKVENDVTINNTVFDGNNQDIYVYGDWNNTGVFRHNRTVYFVGQEQTISQSAFHNVRFGGGNYVKTLAGNINLTGNLYIDDATLDVSPSNYTITLDNNWYNDSTGSFIARQGTVVFTGENSYIFTGAGSNPYGTAQLQKQPGTKDFYNVKISLRSNDYAVFLRGHLNVLNNLEVTNGRIYQSYAYGTYGFNNIYIYGDFVNNGLMGYNNTTDTIFFKASSGTHNFKPGDDNYYSFIVFENNDASTYQLQSNLHFYANRSLFIKSGYVDLNSHQMITDGSDGDITLQGGTLELDSAAVLSIGNGATFTNSGGTFKIIGDPDYPAALIATSGNFYFVQTAGSIAAQYYKVDGTAGNGIEIQGGTVDDTYTFQDGTFSNGTGNAYLTLTGLDLGDRSIANVVFNSGPTYNVSRTSGSGTLTFVDAFGALAGEDYDQDDGDPGTLINWQYPSAVYWDGNTDGDGDGQNWNDPYNWTNDQVPTASTLVILDHSKVVDPYTVTITSTDAQAKAVMLKSGSNEITLKLDGAKLLVAKDISIDANSVLTQTNSTDTIKLGGNWSNSGTFNEGTAAVVFNAVSGSQNITTQGDADPFYDLIIQGDISTVSFGSDLAITHNFRLDSGTVLAGTHTIKVQGDWIVNGGTFDYGQSSVYLNGTDQSIKGGQFYNLILDNSGTKTCQTNIKVARDLTINSGVTFDGQDKFIYVGHNWLNFSGTSALQQTGIGTVVFTGGGNIGSTDASAYATTFNNITIEATGSYYAVKDFLVNGTLKISSGNLYVNDGVTISGNSSADKLEMSGGTLRILGANNFPQDFDQVNMTGGIVYYQGAIDQQIYPTTYYNLYLVTPSSVSLTNKDLTGNITVKGGLVVYDSRTQFNVNSDTIYLYGGLSLATDAPQIDWGTDGTLVHQGGNFTVDKDIDFLNNVVKKNTGYFRVRYKTLEIKGNMSVLEDAYLLMDTCQVICTGTDKSFTLAATARVYSATPATLGSTTNRKAFPYGFAHYNIDKNSTVYLTGTADQILYCVPNYGNLILTTNNSRKVNLDGDLDVEGNFIMNYSNIELVDNGHNINVAGNVDLRNYMPSAGVTLTLDGADQNLDDNTSGYVTLDVQNLVLAGSGTKTLTIDGTDTLKIYGDLTINSGVTFNASRRVKFFGTNWTNNGTFTSTNYRVYFLGNNDQTIDPGDNQFNEIEFGGNATKTIVNHGLDVNNDFYIQSGTTVDFGSLTHKLASSHFYINGTWKTENAHLIFDRNYTQFIPALTARKVTFLRYDNYTRVRYLVGNLNVGDLVIEPGINFYSSYDGNVYDITVRGNFTNQGYMNLYTSNVYFEAENSDTVYITSNGNAFYKVYFNQNLQNQRVYMLADNMRITEQMTIDNNAQLKLNSKTLYLGNNDPDDPTVPDNEEHFINAGGTLQVDTAASLLFSTSDAGDAKLTVYGTLQIIGAPSQNALVSRFEGARRILISVESGATVAAENYIFQYLSDSGFVVKAGASIDPNHNFSNGTWSYMNTSNSGKHYYWTCNADVSGIGTVDNVTFNFDGTPVQGVHFNVRRSASSTGTLQFGGVLHGLLAGEYYEADPTGVNDPGLITWPPITQVQWTGAVSTDWFTAENWQPKQVPDQNTNAIIPKQANNPIITGANAQCRDLIIQDGIVQLNDGYDLNVSGDVYIGTGNDPGILAVNDANSEINVYGSWSRGINGLFVAGDGTVNFVAPTGSVSIDPRNSAFNNVHFAGAAQFVLNRSIIYVDNDFVIENGEVLPSINNYEIRIKGDYNRYSAGKFNVDVTGYVKFVGNSDQTITNGYFDRLSIEGSGTKTTSGVCYVDNRLNISGATLALGDTLKVYGDLYLYPDGTIDDGGQTIKFYGYRWVGNGNYVGTGTVRFLRSGAQIIDSAMFHNVSFENTSYVVLYDSVFVTGDVQLIDPSTYLDLQTYALRNTSGTGTFTLAAGKSIYVRGYNNFPSGFSTYNLAPTSRTYYIAGSEQIIAGYPVSYGNLYLYNSAKKLGGDIDVNGILFLGNDQTSLDVTENNYKITVAGSWYNYYGAKFYHRQGEVIFDGTANSALIIYEVAKDSNYFYNLTVNKAPDAYLSSNYTDITVLNDLRVLNGNLSTNQIMYVYGDMMAFSGKFGTAGTYVLKKPSGTANLQFNGSVLYNLTIDGDATFVVQDGLALNGKLTVNRGVFDGNGKEIQLGNGGEAHEIYGVYKVGPGGTMKLGNLATFRVMSGGQVWVVGDQSNVAKVTHLTGRYYFEVENGGKIFADNYLFEYMSENGIYVKDGALIDNNYNFSNGTFTNIAYGGIGLRIENNQNFTRDLGNQIRNISFPANPGGGAHNIAKFVASTGTIEIEDYSGEFAGEDFDNDPNNLIHWITPPYVVWTGEIDDDWYKPGNWQVNYGPERYPTKDDNVIIPQRVNQPVITTDGAEAKSILIEDNALLVLNSSSATDTTLKVLGDITINGTLQMLSGNDTLFVQGNWNNNNDFLPGQGTVIMGSKEGIKTIDNNNSQFYNLQINSSSTIQLTRPTTVLNDLIIKNGTFDVAATTNYLTIGGDFINRGIFDPRQSIVTLNASSGTHSLDLGGSALYTLNVSADNSVKYNLASDLQINHNLNLNSSTFSLNAHSLYLGDGSGIDVLSINGGVFDISANSSLLPASGTSIAVNDGGTIKIVGSDVNNLAYVQSQSGYYNFRINSGGKVQAQYYDIENTDNEGLHILAGGVIDQTYNLSDGQYRNGYNPGPYLWLENDFSDFTVTGVYFHPGASINVRRTSGSGVITFEDAKGLLAGPEYEDDDGTADGGLVHWSYTHDIFVWTGNVSRDWNDAGNWDGPAVRVPTSDDIVVIPDVSETTNNPPILGITASDNDGACYDLNIKDGGYLTVANDKNLTVSDAVSVLSGGKLEVSQGSNSTITVGDIWSIDGQFIHGGSSTVEFNANAGKLLTITGNSKFYNLTINSASAEYLSGSPIVAEGNFTIQSGTFTVTENDDTLYIGGNWSNSGTFNNGQATVIFNGDNQSVSSTGTGSFYNVTFKGSGTKTLASDVKVDNDLQIDDNITFDFGTNTLTLNGDLTNRGTISAASGTLVLSGDKPQIIDNLAEDAFLNFTVNNSSSTFPQILIYGNVRVLSGGTLTMQSGVVETSNERKFIVSDNVTLSGGSANSYFNGPLIKEGDDDFLFPVGDGSAYAPLELTSLGAVSTFKVQYFRSPYSDVSSTASDVNHVSGFEYWQVDRTDGTGTPYVTLHWLDGAASEIDNLTSLIVAYYNSSTSQWENYGQSATTGDVSAGSIKSNSQFSASGPFTFGSTDDNNPLHSFTQWTGDVSQDWADAGNWTRGVPNASLDAVIPAEPNLQPIISADAVVRKLTINEGASLTIDPLHTLTVDGRLTIDGSLLLKSTSDGNAAIINNDQISYGPNSNVTVQLYLAPKRYYYISAPMTSVSSYLFKGKPYEGTPWYNHNFYVYDETDESNDWLNGWKEYDGYLEIMRGYAVYLDIAYTAEMKRSSDGDLNTGDKSINVSYSENAQVDDSQKGWNLIGNPFPAYLDWDQMIRNNVANGIYFWNGQNYQYYVASADDDYHTDASATNDATSIIPPMQGFFVKALDEGYVGAPASARTTSTHAFYKMQREKAALNEPKTDYIRIFVENGDLKDEALIRFIPPATDEFDADYDAYKLISNYPGIPQVYTLTPSGNRLAINSHKPLQMGDKIYIGFAANKSANYTLTIPAFDLSQDVPVWLIDMQTGDTMEVNGDFSYTFAADKGTVDKRFALQFGERILPDDPSQIQVQIYYSAGYINLRSDIPEATLGTVKLIDLQGRVVALLQSKDEGFARVRLPELSQGVYIVEFENQFRKYHQKVVITGQ